jgi:PAS domain S-box-containing protein
MDTSRFPDASSVLPLVLTGINAGIWEWNVITGDERWSERFYSLLGYNPDELPASYDTFLHELVHPDDRAMIMEAVRAHFEHVAPYQIEFRMRKKDGQYRWFESTGSSLRDENRQPVYMVGAIIDRHEKIALRQQLMETQFLQQEAGRLLKIGAWEYRLRTQEVTADAVVFNVHGIPPTEQATRRLFLRHYGRTSRRIIDEAFRELLRNHSSFDLTVEMTRLDKEVRYVRITGEPIIDHRGRVEALRGVVCDVDAEQRLQKSHAAQLVLLQRRNQQLESFAHIVSHNLRTHAANLTSTLELFESESNDSARNDVFALMKQTASALSETLGVLAETIKIRSNSDIPKALVSIEHIIGRVLDILKPQIDDSGAQIITNIHSAPLVMANEIYLESIVFNLISNAIKYRSPDRQCVVECVTHITDSWWFLNVRDNGQGIDLQRHGDKVFGLYKTFHRHPDARGVGLFLSRSHGESMGGNLSVASIPNESTVFTLALPMSSE